MAGVKIHEDDKKHVPKCNKFEHIFIQAILLQEDKNKNTL